MGGVPFFSGYMENLRVEAAVTHLPALEKKVMELEKIIKELKKDH